MIRNFRKYFQFFLEYGDIDKQKYWEVIDNARSPHLWENRDDWKLKHPLNKNGSKKRIIATLDIKNEKLVKGIGMEGLRQIGVPQHFARAY